MQDLGYVGFLSEQVRKLITHILLNNLEATKLISSNL